MNLLRIFLVAVLAAAMLAAPARAISLLRDPDIEHALDRLARPILEAAGLGATRTEIVLVDDRSLNAFVVDRGTIFIHSGLLLKMESAAMLQAVIAHEAAHIANGHLTRRPVNLRNARTAAGIGMALAAAAAVASGRGEAAGVAALGASNTAMRMFFVHTRAEENAADQSAIRFLTRAGVDPQGMVEVMDIFRGQEMLSAARQDPYARTHPLSRDRYRVVRRLAEAHGGDSDPSRVADYWFHRAKGKLAAFQRAPGWTLNRVGESGFDDVAAMREAIVHHRRSDLSRAAGAIERAIAARPEDPYYHELKGQILFEGGRFRAAAAAYDRARQLAPGNALILGAYGRALLAAGETETALQYLEKSRARDGRDARVLRDLAQAHAKLGQRGEASLVTAERYAIGGRLADAGIHAKRAVDLLPRGSTGWRRAQDVLAASERAEKGN